jgi:hypothetical protein
MLRLLRMLSRAGDAAGNPKAPGKSLLHSQALLDCDSV